MTQDAFAHHADRGSELRLRGRFDLALRELERALQIRPEHAGVIAETALCHSKLGRHAQAIEDARRALAAGPGDGFVHECSARVFHDAGRFCEALVHAKEAIRIRPRTVSAFHLLASVHWSLDDLPAALKAIEEALPLDPTDATSHHCHAFYLREVGRLDESRRAADTALALEPDEFWSHFELARTAEPTGDIAAATRSYREALRLRPDDAECRAAVVRMLRLRNPLFRWVTAYETWYEGLGRWARFGLLGIFYVVTCFWGLLLLLGVRVLERLAGGPLAGPLADIVLRFDRYGRQLLRPEQIVASDRIAMLLLGVAGFVVAVCLGPTVASLFAVPLGAMLVLTPLWIANCRPGRSRWLLCTYVAALLLLATAATIWLARPAPRTYPAAKGHTEVAVVLCLFSYAGCILSISIARRCGYPWTHRFDEPLAAA